MKKEITWLLKEKYNGIKDPSFYKDCQRLKDGEPLGYVIGQVPFLNTIIHLDSKPLIPRVETEYWVERAIEVIVKQASSVEKPLRVLDLCAGSGCIGVAVSSSRCRVRSRRRSPSW